MRGEVTLTPAGTPGANPVATLTFPEGTWPAAPHPMVVRNGGNGGLTSFTFACTSTTLTITLIGTPTPSEVFIFRWMLMG